MLQLRIDDRWRKAGVMAGTLIALSIPISCRNRAPSADQGPSKESFVGGKNCVGCHQREYLLWKGSNHDNAMDVASDSTVLGDFNDAEFPFEGKTHRFYRRDGKFFVFTEGPDGAMKEFQITYTFGVHPLQQYLVPFDNGKLQCLPIAWDTIRKRWFHMAAMVYDRKSRSPGNWLYWTNQAQNWNGMCAECHSTNLQKNFNPATKSFSTTWSDIDVNCEACHGPGSRHLEWAKEAKSSATNDSKLGLVVMTGNISSKRLVELCAPCHSRRSSLGPYDYGHPDYLSDAFPQLITPPNYFADGQIREEDYEFGSFTQSKMYMHGVRCTDCHNPHSLKLRFEGNALCTRCHSREKFDTPAHHFHKEKGEPGAAVVRTNGERAEVGEGALCVNCHMAGRYYMGIHFRRDHSFRIPRPDLTLSTGTPNACNECHANKNPQWSVSRINSRYGGKRTPHYGAVFARAGSVQPGLESDLANICRDDSLPEIVRATALEYLSASQETSAASVIAEKLHDRDQLLRFTAVRHTYASDAAGLLTTLVPLLDDSVRAVRIEAAARLSSLKREQFNETEYRAYISVAKEYEAALEYAADFPTGRFNLAKHYEETGDSRKAEENYHEAIAIDSLFYPAKVNLAFLYYNSRQLARAESLFVDVSANYPEYPDADYNLGLLYAEQGRIDEALRRLESAAARHGSVNVYYNLALLYQRVNEPGKSEAVLLKSLTSEPGEYRTLYALCDLYVKTKKFSKAEKYAVELRTRYPEDPDAQKIFSYIQGQKSH